MAHLDCEFHPKVSQHIDLERELERFQDKRVDKCQDMLEI